MAVRRVASGVGIAASVGLALAACETRDVYFLGPAILGEPDGPHPPPPEAGAGGSTSQPWSDGGDACRVSTASLTLAPVGLYLMIDRSTATLPYWQDVATAFHSFLGDTNSPESVNLTMQVYPLLTDSGTAACGSQSYRKPLYPFGSLTDVGSTLDNYVSGQTFNPLLTAARPEAAALRGAIAGTRDWLATPAGAGAQGSVVLVSPDLVDINWQMTCDATIEDTITSAAEGMNTVADGGDSGLPVVQTFVLSVGATSSAAGLEQVASAGGTGHTYAASTATSTEVLSQLFAIRDAASPCTLPASVPELQNNVVNVQLSAFDHSKKAFFRVSNAKSCIPADELQRGQWYAEVTASGGSVHLCPTTCKAARAAPGSKVEIISGCPTQDLL